MLCGSKPPSEGKQKSDQIDKELRDERRKLRTTLHVLLLGTGESGKSTIIKQMKILHSNGFSDEEKKEKIVNIKQNIHESIYTLLYNMDKISPPVALQNEENKQSADYILKLGEKEPSDYSDEYFEHVKLLWADRGVKEAFKRSNEFQLIDSASHFLDRIDDIRQQSYIPTVQDMLFCRIMTVGISKIEFKVPYKGQQTEFWMYDVGGQKGERRKWISFLEGMSAILFLIAASDFDQTLREDGKTNRLKEGFKVFNDIFWSRVCIGSKIVFLNKQDLLKQKIEDGKRMENYFPEYKDCTMSDENVNSLTEYDKVKSFLKDKILHIAPYETTPEMVSLGWYHDRDVKIHYTVATDTNNVKLVIDSVQDTILHDNLTTVAII